MKSSSLISVVGPIVAAFLTATGPAAAQDQGEESCTTVKQNPGGTFSFEFRPDINVRTQTSRPGPFLLQRPENVVGVTCLRESLVPKALDLEVLQAGFTFAIGDAESGTRVIQLEMSAGRVTWAIIAGTITGRERRLVDEAVGRMNASLRSATGS